MMIATEAILADMRKVTFTLLEQQQNTTKQTPSYSLDVLYMLMCYRTLPYKCLNMTKDINFY